MSDNTPNILIYTSPICGYCEMAKRLLDSKGLSYDTVDIASDPSKRDEMLAKANGQRTVPQIFINDHHVGGFTDLAAIDRNGELTTLLQENS